MKSSVHTSVLFFLLCNQRGESRLVLFRVPPRPPARGTLRDRDQVANDLLEVVLGVESLAVGAAFEGCQSHRKYPVEIRAASAVSKAGKPLRSHDAAPNGS